MAVSIPASDIINFRLRSLVAVAAAEPAGTKYIYRKPMSGCTQTEQRRT